MQCQAAASVRQFQHLRRFDDPSAVARQGRLHLVPFGKDHRHPRVLQHIVQTILREAVIQRHIGSARLHDRQRINDHPRTAVDHHADDGFPGHALSLQINSQPRGKFIDFLIGILPFLIDNRHRIRMRLCLYRKQINDGLALIEGKRFPHP